MLCVDGARDEDDRDIADPVNIATERGLEFELEDAGTLNAERTDQHHVRISGDINWTLVIDAEEVLEQGGVGCGFGSVREHFDLSHELAVGLLEIANLVREGHVLHREFIDSRLNGFVVLEDGLDLGDQ